MQIKTILLNELLGGFSNTLHYYCIKENWGEALQGCHGYQT